jgi:putative hydrolase of the HAD superfamily
LAQQIVRDYTQAREESLCLFPDTLPTLSHLRSAGVKLVLITNGQAELQRRKIERFALADYFSVILVEGEFGLGKPDERVYLHVLEHLGIAAIDAWMVGDNLDWEVAAPQRLGMKGIWYDVEGNGLPPTSPVRPDRIIHRLSELLT